MTYTASAKDMANETHACNCVGPQNGQPKCPCMMRGIVQRDGRWIEPERDLGPVRLIEPTSNQLKAYVANLPDDVLRALLDGSPG